MTDPQIEKLAHLLLDYSLRLRAGDLLRIRGEVAGLPLITAVHRLAVQRGAHPFVVLTQPEWERDRLRYAPETALDYLSPLEKATVEQIDADLVVLAETDPYALSGIDPARSARRERARTQIIQRWQERTGLGEHGIRWCAVLFPIAAYALQARCSHADFTTQIVDALFLDREDPIAAWEAHSAMQQRICEQLVERNTLRVIAPGTDITFSVRDRGWYNANGRLNLPDGEVATSPVEDSAEGIISFSFPTTWQGREVSGVRLWLERGRVVRHAAEQGEDFLRQMLALDEGASGLGEFAIGLNPALSLGYRHPLLDEKIDGTCHFALGNSLPGTGGSNRSALHWDMVVDLRRDGRIMADGDLIYEKGQFLGKFGSPPPRRPFWKRGG